MSKLATSSKSIRNNDALLSIALRALTLPISAASVIFTTRIVIDTQGIENYAVFSILIALPMMIPISDFGISVAVTDSAAKYGLYSNEFQSVWKKSRQLLALISIVTLTLGIGMAAGGLWSPTLGIPEGLVSEVSGLIMAAHLALTIYLGVGQRLLLGIQKQQITLVFSVIAAPLSLALVTLLVHIPSSNLSQVVLGYAIGQLSAPLACFLYARRRLPSNTITATADCLSGYTTLLRAAIPMTVISIALPLTYQSDRLFLSHQLTDEAVATYSVVSTVYLPILSILTIGSQSLWPKFMGTYYDSEALRASYARSLRWFVILGAVLAVAFVAVAPYITEFMSPGVNAPGSLFALFGCMIFLFGVHAAPGMLLMDFRGRVIQACSAVLMLGLKVPLSIHLVATIGVSGAILGTVISLTLFMIIPCTILSLQQLRKL